MNASARSTLLLAADRSRRLDEQTEGTGAPGELGNHSNGWNVLQVDGGVHTMEIGDKVAGLSANAFLAKAGKGGAYLSVLDQTGDAGEE